MKRSFLDAAVALGAFAVAGLPIASAHDATAPMLGCAAEKDDARRLACFDAEVTQLRKESLVGGATPASVAATPTAPTPAAGAAAAASVAATSVAASPAAAVPAATPTAESLSPEEKFGLRGELKQQRMPELQELTATATKVATKPHGELVVTLDNGQVWTEIAPNSAIRLKVGDEVTIKAGTLGSYMLAAPNGRSSKVTRVR